MNTAITPTFGNDIDVVEFAVEVEPGDIVQYDHARLCTALGVKDPSCLIVEAAGNQALITIYRQSPLVDLPEATPADLTMDAKGYITVGRHHDGRPGRERLYVPGSGAQRAAMFGTTGAGKSRALQLRLAGQRRSGIVSWNSDLKGGQSIPEARASSDLFITSQRDTLIALKALIRLAEYRMQKYAAWGRSSFIINDPDPLIIYRIDEANRLLEKGAPYREEATTLIKEAGRTGRSVGIGIAIAGQGGHLDELGGSDTLRAMLKEGSTTLLRSTSSMMQQLVTDGLLPPGTRLSPIPKEFGAPTLHSRFDVVDENEEDSETAGMAYLLGSKRPLSLMRHFRVGSDGPVSGLDPKILALYGDRPIATVEEDAHDVLGSFYIERHNDGPITLNGVTPKDHEDETTAGDETRSVDFTKQAPADGLEIAAGLEATAPKLPATTRIERALTDGPLTKADLIQAVNTDGGRELSDGGIANALTTLTRKGKVANTGGYYELTT